MDSSFDDRIAFHANRTGLDPLLLKEIVRQESGGDPNAVSPKGAIGIAQVMPTTAAQPGYGVTPLDPAKLKDPEENIRFAADYLSMTIRELGSEADGVRGYNGGPEYVREWRAKGGDVSALYPETREYEANITSRTDAARLAMRERTAPSSAPVGEQGIMGTPIAKERKAKSNIPDSWLEKRGDEVEMLGKGLLSGMLETGALIARVADGPLELTGGLVDSLQGAADSLNDSLPEWIKDDIHRQVFTRTEDGGWEFDMPSLRAIANLAVQSAGPGGAIALGGKGLAKFGAKTLPKLFTEGARLAPAGAYGAANAGYIAADSYQNVYQQAYAENLAKGMTEDEADAEAESMARVAAMAAGTLSAVTGTIGGFALTAGGVLRRIGTGAALGSATEAVEEPGQYVAEQLAQGKAVDPAEVASRAVLGALAAGPMEGIMAGLSGTDPETGEPAPVDPTAKAGGEKLVDDILGDVPIEAGMEPLNLNTEYHAKLDEDRQALPESLPALPGEPPPPPAPPPVMGTPEQTTTTAGPEQTEGVPLTWGAPLTAQGTDQVTDPATAEPNVYMDELGNIWDQDGNPAERPAPEPEPAPKAEKVAVPPSTLQETPKHTSPEAAEDVPVTPKQAEYIQWALDEMESYWADEGLSEQRMETDADIPVHYDPSALPQLKKVKGKWYLTPSPVEDINEDMEYRVTQQLSDMVNGADVEGLTAEEAKRTGDLTPAQARAARKNIENFGAKLTERKGRLESTAKKEQKKLEKLEAKVADAEAQAQLDALEDERDQGTPGLMIDEEEEFDPAAAMAAATAKLEAESETAPEQTPEEQDAQLNEESRAEAGAMTPMQVNAAYKKLPGVPKKAKAADKREAVAMSIKEKKMALAAAPLDPNAAAADRAAEEAHNAEQAKAGRTQTALQAAWDGQVAIISDPKTPMSTLKTIFLNRKLNKDADGKKVPLPRSKKAMSEAILADVNAKDPRPADHVPVPYTAPEATAEPVSEQAEVTPSPATLATPTDGTAEAPVQPESTVEPEVEKPANDVQYDADGKVKPSKLVSSMKSAAAAAKKHWGDAWGRGVQRITVGNRVFTIFRPLPPSVARGNTPIEIKAAKMAGASSYVYIEGEVADHNPETDGAEWRTTNAKNAKDAYAFLKNRAQGDHAAAERQAALDQRVAGPQPPSDDLLVTEAQAAGLTALSLDPNSDEFVVEADRVISMFHRAQTKTARKAIGDVWIAMRDAHDALQVAGTDPDLTTKLNDYRTAKKQATAVGEAETKALEEGQRAADRRAQEEADNTEINEYEQAVLEAEEARGLSMAAAGYWLRHKFRNLRQGTEQSVEDARYKQDNPVQAAILEESTLAEVISRALHSQDLKWITRLQDNRYGLKERQLLLQKVIKQHNAGLDEGNPKDRDKMWHWSDELDAYAKYDQQDAKVGAKIDAFTKNQQAAYAKALTDAGVSEKDMNDYLVSVQALWRNAHLRRQQFKQREAKGGTDAVKPSPSGVTDRLANATIERLRSHPAGLAAFESLFTEHIQKMTEMQRAVYKEHNLVPDAILSRWEPGVAPADLYKVPDPNDINYDEKVNAGFRYTYVPLQNTPVDYNKDMTLANLRQTDLASIGDVYGDEVKAAVDAPVSETLPQHVYAQIKANIIKAYVRGEHNNTLQAVAKMAKAYPNRYMWRVVTQEGNLLGVKVDENGETVYDPLTGEPEMATFDIPESTPDYNLRQKSGVTALRAKDMTTLRFKDENGRGMAVQVHDSVLATALAPEPSLNNWPLRNLGKISRWVSSINTTYSPGFMLVNPVRDILSAKIQLQDEGMGDIGKNLTVKGYKTMMKAYWQELRNVPRDGTNDAARDLIDQYRAAGGHTAFYRQESLADHVKTLASDMAALQTDGKAANIKKMLSGLGAVMRDTNTAFENVARLLAFEGAKKAGMSDQQAATISKNLVVNFGRRGTWGPALNALYPFYNASVQGNAILWQVWKRSPKVKKATAALAGLGLVNGVMQELISGDDDDGRSKYANLSDHVKERNLVIWIPGTDDYIKVPLPYGLNVPVVIGDSLAGAFMAGDPSDIVHNMMRPINAAKSTFNPIASSTVLRTIMPLVGEPVVDVLTNRNFFGSPINPDRSPYETGKVTDAFNVRDPDKSGVSITIAQQLAYMTGGNPYREGLIDVAPGTLRYMWDTVLGSAGSTVRRVAEIHTVRSLSDAGVKTPVIRRFFGTQNDFHHKERYYEMREDLAQLQKEKDFFKANRRSDSEGYVDFMRENREYWDKGVMRKFDSTEKKLRKYIRKKNEIRKIAGKTDSQRDRMDYWNKKIDDTVTGFNSFYYNKFIRGEAS